MTKPGVEPSRQYAKKRFFANVAVPLIKANGHRSEFRRILGYETRRPRGLQKKFTLEEMEAHSAN
jgi:hypothetical protein